jgi:hypothetical protein
LKKVSVVKSTEIEVKPFMLDDFIQVKQKHVSIEKITKKTLKKIADELELDYNDKEIVFTKKLITAYLKDRIK